MKRRRNQAVAAGAAAVVIAGTLLLWPGEADDSGSAPSAASETSTSIPEPTPTETPSSTPSVDQASGTLTVSTQLIDLGSDGTSSPVRLTNTGAESLSYRVTTSTPWLTVLPAGGSIAGGGSSTVVVSAQRSELSEGKATGAVTITWGGGSAPITVRLTQEQPPTVGRLSLGASACGSSGRTVEVSAAASDDSGLDSVVLRWSGPSGPGRATMSPSGSTWSGLMGPFRVGGQVTLSVTATDKQGNATTGPSTSTNVDPCPQ